MIEECARHPCTDEDGAALLVIEYRHIFTTSMGQSGDQQRRPGATWLTLADGEPVRYVDARRFEVIGTGAVLLRTAAAERAQQFGANR